MIKLTPWQKLVQHAAKARNHIALFAPTGCGKSIAALAACFRGWGLTRVLILARKNNLLTWKKEGEIYGVKITPCVGSVVPLTNVVVSHDKCKSLLRKLLRERFQGVIVDEGYQVKNPKARRSKAAYNVVRRSSRSILLNALPFSDQGYVDIFGQYRVLDSGDTFGSSLTRFREAFQYEHPEGYGWIDKPSMFRKLTKMASRSALFLSKEDCDLPKGIDKTIWVDWHPKQKKVYDMLLNKWEASFKDSTIEIDHTISKLCKLHQICGGVFNTRDKLLHIPTRKIEALENLLEQIGNNKAVIWCAYNAEIRMLTHLFSLRGHRTASYTGQSKEFPRGWRLLFAQIRCGVGLNDLTNVQYSIYYSRYWNWYYDQQSRGRTARLSSKHKKAFYFSITIQGSMDEMVEKNLKHKNTKAEEFAALGREILT